MRALCLYANLGDPDLSYRCTKIPIHVILLILNLGTLGVSTYSRDISIWNTYVISPK